MKISEGNNINKKAQEVSLPFVNELSCSNISNSRKNIHWLGIKKENNLICIYLGFVFGGNLFNGLIIHMHLNSVSIPCVTVHFLWNQRYQNTLKINP